MSNFTPEELEAIICSGIECGIINVFSRAVAGSSDNRSASVELSQDGTIKIIPSLSIGQSLTIAQRQSQNGQARGIKTGLDEFIQKVIDYYNDVTVSSSQAVNYLIAEYNLNDTVANVIPELYTDIGNGAELPQTTSSAIEESLYCEGFTLGTINTHIINNQTVSRDSTLTVTGLLLQDQIEEWAVDGASVPVDDWKNYYCTLREPVPIRYFVDDWNNDVRKEVAMVSSWSVSQKAQLVYTGKIGIDDNNFHDGMYRWENGVPTLDKIEIGVRGNWGGNRYIAFSIPNQPPSENGYQFTVTMPKYFNNFASSLSAVYVQREISQPSFFNGSQTGELKITMNDIKTL